MDKRIGIIGLGIMGGAFARNLVGGGWSVIGYDTEPKRNAEAKAAGVEIAHSAEAVAEAAADIITSLPTPRAVLDTAEVIARTNVEDRTVVEASTLALRDKIAFKEMLEKAGHAALDCPMSGTGAQAAVKDLVVYASGDSAAIKRLEPAFLGFARKVFDLGAYGNGSRMKFVANHLVAIHNVAAAEAMVLAMKAGLDPKQTVEVVASRPRHRAARRHPRHGPRRGGQRRRLRRPGADGGPGTGEIVASRRSCRRRRIGACAAVRRLCGLRTTAPDVCICSMVHQHAHQVVHFGINGLSQVEQAPTLSGRRHWNPGGSI
jgi:3-hydroxyisobutyrate dehydrogenase-like beta-hydroxyacid dehydrogenase